MCLAVRAETCVCVCVKVSKCVRAALEKRERKEGNEIHIPMSSSFPTVQHLDHHGEITFRCRLRHSYIPPGLFTNEVSKPSRTNRKEGTKSFS